MRGFLTVATTLVIVAAILFFAWWFTRKLATGTAFRSAQQSEYMKIIDRIPVTQDKAIIIVRAGENHYMIGVSQAGLSLLAQIDEDDLLPIPPVVYEPTLGDVNFKDILQKIGGRKKDGQ